MKKKHLLFAGLLFPLFTLAQNVGIGINIPLSKLHVRNGALLADGSTGNTPVSGAGTRFMWIPVKAAIRAGEAYTNYWDEASVGMGSAAFGVATKADGASSFAAGNTTWAKGTAATTFGELCFSSGYTAFAAGYGTGGIGDYSTAFTRYSEANGNFSFAAGDNSHADGDSSVSIGSGSRAGQDWSIAVGNQALALGEGALSVGFNNTASGNYSAAIGLNSRAENFGTVAMGSGAKARGMYSTAIGVGVVAKHYASFVVGKDNDTSYAGDPDFPDADNRIFEVGNGGLGTRRNAMTILQTGYVGIGTTTPSERLHVQGDARLSGTLTVQDNKGIVRSRTSTQQKVLSSTVSVNIPAMADNATTTIAVNWPESFSAAPVAFVGNVISATGGWAETDISLASVTTTGAVLWLHNTFGAAQNKIFTINIVAIGAE